MDYTHAIDEISLRCIDEMKVSRDLISLRGFRDRRLCFGSLSRQRAAFSRNLYRSKTNA